MPHLYGMAASISPQRRVGRKATPWPRQAAWCLWNRKMASSEPRQYSLELLQEAWTSSQAHLFECRPYPSRSMEAAPILSSVLCPPTQPRSPTQSPTRMQTARSSASPQQTTSRWTWWARTSWATTKPQNKKRNGLATTKLVKCE